MKKAWLMLLLLCMLNSFAGCGGDPTHSGPGGHTGGSVTDASPSATPTVTPQYTAPSSTPTPAVSPTVTPAPTPTPTRAARPTGHPTLTSTPTPAVSPYRQATDSDDNVTVSREGIVSITIPKWFLLKMEPGFNYTLTETEKNLYRFISVSKNADGSATYKIGYNDYHGFLLISRSNVNAVVNKYKHNTWFTEIRSDAGFSDIQIYTMYTTLEEFDDEFGLYIAMSGVQTTFYQYLNYNYSVGTTITVYNKDNIVLGSYRFPDLLK